MNRKPNIGIAVRVTCQVQLLVAQSFTNLSFIPYLTVQSCPHHYSSMGCRSSSLRCLLLQIQVQEVPYTHLVSNLSLIAPTRCCLPERFTMLQRLIRRL